MKDQTITDKLKAESKFFRFSPRFLMRSEVVIFVLAVFAFSYVVNLNLVIPLFLIALAISLKYLYHDLNQKTFKLLNLTLLFLIIFATSHIMIHKGLSTYFIPFGIVPMLAAILFGDLVISFFLTVASAVAISYLVKEPSCIGILFLIGGMLSSMLVFDARRRNTILNAGIIVGVAQALSLFLLQDFSVLKPENYLTLFLNGIASGIIVIGVLPIFELLFGTVTNITLLELADFNNPILNRLMIEAPGTYHHSLIVGNLSEAACKAIGANSLLARIGAYYHDIGKLQKPDYFTENQVLKSNVHEALAPNMSKLVIMNHVKEGVELAKKAHLNNRIIDFIQQHHGKSLVYYFYKMALENSDDEQAVGEEGFRYPGPKPNSKETAVVLLADSVEAATRALKEPTLAKIAENVHKIINNKFIDGQLDECELTLKDIETISTVFIHILGGIYHSRVNYPEERRESS
jgi:hypothetical protein